MTNCAGIPDELKNRENFSFSLHWESQNEDIAICTYIVNTKSKDKKSVILLSSIMKSHKFITYTTLRKAVLTQLTKKLVNIPASLRQENGKWQHFFTFGYNKN